MEGVVSPKGRVKRKSLKSVSRSSLKSGTTTLQTPPNKRNGKVAIKVKSGSPKEPVTTIAPAVDCLEGMSASELTMVRRLAGNDPVVRKKTLRKLRKWLNVLAQKVPDSPDSRRMIEPNFVRVWKALFYCMWMADKPLPQEQLAESISELQNIFVGKTAPFLLFVEWFVRTMAREWSWIDRFRIDKFMMLFRRFIRKTLLVISDKKWHNDIVDGFMKIVSTYIFNRHPTVKSKKQPLNAPITNAPLGLQIHFTDIFMEELAKVGGSSLKFQKILKILTIFINELGYSNDERLMDEIRERIFHHLMRQSDVGIDYQEELMYGGVQEEDDDEEADEEQDDAEELGEEDKYLEDAAEDDVENNGVLDPRAGAVDVILPQLDIDYEKLYQKLVEFGGQKEIKLKNRRMLYSLASQFKELTEGKYPLAIPKDEDKKRAIPRKEITKAAKELVEMELSDSSGKKRKSKKQRKRDAIKAQRALNETADSVGSEDNSQYIHDEDLLDHVSDNYMSYLEDELDGEPPSTDDIEEANEVEGQNDDEEEKVKETTPKGNKGKKRKWKTVVEVEADDLAEAPANVEDDLQKEPSKEEVVVVKRPKLNKRASLGSNVVASTPLRGKVRRLSELRTPINAASSLNNSLTKSASKRVSFVLARNLEHEHADYPVSIARSPAIPYDKTKRPSIGLLKSPHSTPKSTPVKRANALDFF